MYMLQKHISPNQFVNFMSTIQNIYLITCTLYSVYFKNGVEYWYMYLAEG